MMNSNGDNIMALYDLSLLIEELNDGSDYRHVGSSPDLPNLIVVGDTVDEVLSLAPQVTAALIASMTPVHPGEILLEEFLRPFGISQYRLAQDIGVHPRRINEIVMESAPSALIPPCDYPATLDCRNVTG